jgi:WhiB family transcriptional regulator, redox-sensing transcriptional regulator
MTRARMPRPHEVAAARRDPRLLRAFSERQHDGAWRTRGVCQTVDPETFFPAPSEPADAAVALCRTCEVQGACLAWALEVGDCHGVWGATTPRERRAMLVAWRADTRGEEPPDLTARPAALTAAVAASGTVPVERHGDRLINLIPEQRTRLPLLDDRGRRHPGRCGQPELVGRVAS